MSQYRHSEYSHHESPDTIKADIEQTRAEMGAKIDRIKERMDPEQLKAQAQETVNEVLTDTANSISDYVRTNRRQITDSIVDTIKHNPIPAALIGVGLGWMFVDAFSSSDTGSYDEYRYRSRRYTGGPYRRRMAYENYGPGYDDVGYYQTEGRYTEYQRPYQSGSEGSREIDDNRNWADEKVHETRAQVSHLADQARNRAAQAGEQVSHGAEQAGQQIRHTAEQTGEQIRHGAEELGRQAQDLGEQVSHQAQQLGAQVGRQTAEVSRQAQRQAIRAGNQVQRSLEEHPVTFGAMAFAAGAAIGLLLPQTRAENRMMGETREQLMESGQAVARDVAQRAQHIAEEVRPELEETAQHVADDLRETGRQAYEDVRQTAQKAQDEAKQTMEKAQEKAESEGEKAKAKAKKEAAKVGQTAEQKVSKAGEKAKEETDKQGESQRESRKSGKESHTGA